MEWGELAQAIIITEGEKVAQILPHSTGVAVKLVQGEDKGTEEGGEGEGVDPLIIDQEVVDIIRGPVEVLHNSRYTIIIVVNTLMPILYNVIHTIINIIMTISCNFVSPNYFPLFLYYNIESDDTNNQYLQ